MKGLTILLATLFAVPSFAQNWGRNTESAFVNEALDVEVDANGNTYTTGYITGETAFDVSFVQTGAAGNGDIYVAKYSQSGSLLWVRKYGGNFSDRAYDLAIDQANNVIITGQFYGSVAFGTTTLVSASNSKDIFIAKISPSGVVLWARKEGGSSSENAYGITTDNLNNVILTGQFEGTSTIAGSTFTSITDPSTNLPSYDLFISKYDSNGNPLWVKQGEADYEDRGLAVHTDGNNNIFMTGQFSDTLTFAGQTFNNNGYNVGFLAKLNPAGQLQWLNTLRAGLVLPYDLEINSVNEVVVIGDFIGTLQYTDANGITAVSNPYSKQIFAIKTDNNGMYQWNQTLGSDNTVSARALAVDNAKDIYITGYFSCGWSELRTTQTATFNSVGEKDSYLWKIGNNGSSLFVKQFGGKKNDIGHGVAIRNNIDPIVCGSYTENLNIPKDVSLTYSTSTSDYDLITGALPPHVFLHGDQSQNSFVTSAVNSLTPSYNFFDGQPIDSLLGHIVPDQDTVHFCEDDILSYETYTYDSYGPNYNYLWSTGSDSSLITVTNDGTYSVLIEREDGCASGMDTIEVFVHSLPNLPTMSDNLGLAVNAPGSLYYEYFLCDPDSVQTWFNGLDPNYSISINGLGTSLFSDSLPHFYDQTAIYTVIISDSFCTNTAVFSLELEYTYPPELVPYLMMEDGIMYADSIVICDGDPVFFNLLDSLENPNGIFGQFPADTTTAYSWTSNNYYTSSCTNAFRVRMYPSVSGWYPVTFAGAIGYDNSCGLDTIHITITDSFYIEVLSTPTISNSILGDNLFCPNGSVYLTLTNPATPGLMWSGPGINWISTDSDSVQVTAAGTYQYQGIFTDTLTGCTDNFFFSHTLTEKVPPIIVTDPTDAIICPNDSVHMSVDDIYSSYDWTGPTGSSLSITHEHWDDEQGFYYVTVVDNEGCSLTSAPIEITEYTSPYLTTVPTNILCTNDTISLLAIFEGNGQAQWTWPIVSNSSQLTVNQAGWYYCELEHCGITVYDSIEVIDGTFTASLTLSDSVLCYGDSAVISAPIGLSTYDWSSGQSGLASISVSAGGDFSATLMNNYGCIQETDTVTVTFVTGSEPPIISDITGCAGDTILLQNLVPIPTDWFTSDTSFISTGFELVLPNQASSTTILASYGAFGICPASYDEIVITLADSITGVAINGDIALCPEEVSSFSLSGVAGLGYGIEWFVNGTFISNSFSVLFPTGTFIDGDTLSVEITDACFTTTLFETITVFNSPVVEYGVDSILVCYDSDLTLELPQTYASVSWLNGGVLTNGTQLNLYNITSDETVYVNAIDANGCASNTDIIVVDVAQGGIYIEDNQLLICKGDSVDWLAVTPLDSIVWSTPFGAVYDSSFSVIANAGTAGIYIASGFDSLGCAYSDTSELVYYDYPTLVIPEDTILCLNTYLSFENLPDTNTYTWNGNSILDSTAVSQNQWLVVVSTSPQGCVTTDSVFIETVNCNATLTNVFTPNGDGINDYFIIHLTPLYPNNSLTIMNRWGNVIYDVDRYDNTFTGEGLADGTYFYYFYTKGREHPESIIQGHLTILRN